MQIGIIGPGNVGVTIARKFRAVRMTSMLQSPAAGKVSA